MAITMLLLLVVGTDGFVATLLRARREALSKVSSSPKSPTFEVLSSIKLPRAADGVPILITSQWTNDGVAVVAFFRSFGADFFLHFSCCFCMVPPGLFLVPLDCDSTLLLCVG